MRDLGKVISVNGPIDPAEFLEATTRAGAIRTLESLARIEAGAEGGALVERTTTTRTAKNGATTTTVRERWTPPDWRADGWFLERRHPAEWSRRTELVVPDHDQAAAVDPLVGVHDELRLARLRQRRPVRFAVHPRCGFASPACSCRGPSLLERFECAAERQREVRFSDNHDYRTVIEIIVMMSS